ncbi:unnamed protein product [Linum trigynum]|uniref:Uncharacterized protein n=1 Tax=Linum trigynum TaxID=586398 RepID=A0AAV2FLI6_9ROSI
MEVSFALRLPSTDGNGNFPRLLRESDEISPRCVVGIDATSHRVAMAICVHIFCAIALTYGHRLRRTRRPRGGPSILAAHSNQGSEPKLAGGLSPISRGETKCNEAMLHSTEARSSFFPR